MIELLQGDCRTMLKGLADKSVQMCVTSPPYWGQRVYTDSPDEIGQEPTYQDYIAALVSVFDELWRVLRDDATLWMNLGDAYANDTKWGGASGGKNYTSAGGGYAGQRTKRTTGLPPKSLIGLPWRVAFALQDRGWVLRTEIIWEKANAMPESVDDRPTRSHEYIFLFAKQPHYFCDMAAIAVPAVRPGDVQTFGGNKGRQYTPTPDDPNFRNGSEQWGRTVTCAGMVNARTVWRISTSGIPDEHYAPYPAELARRCILAGSRPGDTVLDPFIGSGTTARVCEALGRNCIGIDLGYQELQEKRTNGVQVEMEAFL